MNRVLALRQEEIPPGSAGHHPYHRTAEGRMTGIKLRVLSLGAGVQSTTLALMAAAGDGSVRTQRNAACRPCEALKSQAHREADREKFNSWARGRCRRLEARMTPEEFNEKVLIPRRAYGQNRRARLREGQGVSAVEIKKCFAAQRSRCWWCGCKLKPGWHIDHRIPIAKGGVHSAANIVIACPTCNLRKQARMPWQFAGRLL